MQDQSDTTVSIYVVFGLVKARQSGFAVDDTVINRGVEFLKSRIKPATQINTTWEANQQTYLLYTLAEAGQSQTGALVSMYDGKRQLLSHYGKALLALGLKLDQPNEQSRVNTLLTEFVSNAKASATGMHWEEVAPDWWSWNTDTRSTAIVLDAIAQARSKKSTRPERCALADDGAHGRPLGDDAGDGLVADRADRLDEGHRRTESRLQLGREDQRSIHRERDGQSGHGETVGDVVANDRGAAARSRQCVVDRAQFQCAAIGRRAAVLCRLSADVHPGARGEVAVARRVDLAPVLRQQRCVLQAAAAGREGDPVYAGDDGQSGRRAASEAQHRRADRSVLRDGGRPAAAGAEAVDTSLKTTTQIGEGPQLNPTDRYSYYGGWGWWWFTHTELRDEKVALFATSLPSGSYEYTYQIRAGMSGTFNVIPAHAEEMYFPEVFGRSDGGTFVIER